jgi:hypothetical protein
MYGRLSGEPGVIHEEWVGPEEEREFFLSLAREWLVAALMVGPPIYCLLTFFHIVSWWA